MYINPFWAGVAATICAEFVVLLIYAVMVAGNKKK